MSENNHESEERAPSGTGRLGKQLDAAGWGLFFIWVGTSLLMDLSWGAGLVGVAAIILLIQGARSVFGRKLEYFWVVVGGLFLLGGIWDLYRIDLDPVPVLLILFGGVLLLGLFRRRSGPTWSRCWHRCR